jgi:dihydrofolate synthase/folylpolyglutamate synthase
MPDQYQESLDFLYGRLNYERQGMPRLAGELRLGRMRRLLRRLGDPHVGLKVVHVAGTKGKGSTSAMLAAALTAAGFRTGLFSSPHLHRLEERFRVDGRQLTPGGLVGLVERVRPTIEALDAENESRRQRGPTFFETTTAMGLAHFASEGADVVVLEVGMGGRLDSTNVVRPVVSVITNISLDHTRQLGSTLAAIAREKAGIIKHGRPVVAGDEGDDARGVFRAVARQRRCVLREVGHDFRYDYHAPVRPLARPTPGRVSVRTWLTDWGTLDLPLLGAHQARNAAVALATLDVLAENGLEVSRSDVARGFARLTWPARVEVFDGRPTFVIDGAHNVASAEALADTLRECFPPGPRTLVFGTTRDKDLRGQLRALLPAAARVVATRYLENPRAVAPEEVAAAVVELGGPPVVVTHTPPEALEAAIRVTPGDGLVCLTGSLFLAAEARAVLLSSRDVGARER